MTRNLIYQLSLAAVGFVFALTGSWRLNHDGPHTSSLLMLIGGVILLSSVGYAQYSNLDIDSPPLHIVWLTILGAILITVGAIIVFIG